MIIAQSKRDPEMVELFSHRKHRDAVWGVFHRDALYNEPGGLYEKLPTTDEIEVVIVERAEYDLLVLQSKRLKARSHSLIERVRAEEA